MGRTALAVLSWLAISDSCLGTVPGSGRKDHAGAESAPRLYRNAPSGIYASAAPHGAFTFQVPAAIALKPTQLIPVNQESLVIEKSNGFLKDSYGNKFVAPSQSVEYKTTYPQQFVQLQHLPDHLAQPLSAAPSYHFPHGPSQAFFGAQYRLPSLDAVTSPLTRYGVTHPFAYAGGVKSLTPASDQQFHFVSPTQAQQDTKNQVIYGTQNYSPVHNEPKFQRLEEKPAAHHIEHYEVQRQPQVAQSINSQVQAPVSHTVKTTHNGKDTVVQIETKPPLPLLDLSLLEPLTFTNPIVPQVQHYLPKINAVTYKELHPSDVDEVKKHKNEFVVQKTKSYDSGVVKGKPHSDEPKKKQKKPLKKDTNVHVHYEHKSEKPSIKVKGKPNDAEYSYEIKSPNYKETYNEQVVSYNKDTKNDPVSYSYQKETQKKPVTYSYSHSSKDPGQTKTVQYVKKDPVPNHLVYQFKQAEQDVKHMLDAPPETESEDSRESSESDDENPSYDHAQYNTYHDKPSHSHQSDPSSHSRHSHPSTSLQQSHNPTHSHSSQSHHPFTHSHNPTHSHSSQSHHLSSHSHNPTHAHSSQSHHPSTHSHNTTHSHSSQSHHPSTHSHNPTHSHYSQSHHPSTHYSTQSRHPSTQSHDPNSHSDSQSHHPTTHSHSAGRAHPSPHPHYSTDHPATHSHQSQPQQANAEQQSHNPNHAYYTVTQKSPQYYSHPQLTPLHEFMETLRFIPSFTNAAIRVDPNQHIQKEQVIPQHYYLQQTTPGARSEGQLTSEPVIYEKSKKIIIQEESPDEVHSHQEKLTAQMVGKEENNEEDFEKSYKEAAYGFPAYDRDSGVSEEEIYNPENYGEPHNSEEDTGKHFEEYQEEGDEFPKFARLGYKDARDKMKESYYQDYSIQKPESMTDRYQSKINYYKMFLKNKPEKLRHSGNSNKNKELAKYTVAPSFFDSAPKQKSQQSAAYKAAPTFEYDYLKDSRDSSAHASRPNLRYKSRTHFVEPQFQYGFEPIAIPRLDSELDAMASNVSPESEKPGTRKKLYKENWYIKKTSTSSKPS